MGGRERTQPRQESDKYIYTWKRKTCMRAMRGREIEREKEKEKE